MIAVTTHAYTYTHTCKTNANVDTEKIRSDFEKENKSRENSPLWGTGEEGYSQRLTQNDLTVCRSPLELELSIKMRLWYRMQMKNPLTLNKMTGPFCVTHPQRHILCPNKHFKDIGVKYVQTPMSLFTVSHTFWNKI